MTRGTAAAFRAVSFGTLAGDLWGAAVSGELDALALSTPSGPQHRLGRDSIDWMVSGERWQLTADGLQLVLDPCDRPTQPETGEGDPGAEEGRDGASVEVLDADAHATAPGHTTDIPGAASGDLDQLCRVWGQITIDGVAHQIDCPGIRTRREPGLALRDLDSLRAVGAWFGEGEGITLLSLRPRGAGDHSHDLSTASIFAPEAWRTVDEPRLSTTYAADGAPTRVGLELWLRDGDEHYPRRAAGEVAGPELELRADGLEILMSPLRCHSHGHEGAGVYLLVRRG